MMESFDAFEEKLQNALQSDEMPSPDFMERVMAQVHQTPQETAVTKKKQMPKIKVWQMAACAALVVLAVPVIRMTTMRAGSAPKMAATMQAADCAAPAECEEICEEPAADGCESYNGITQQGSIIEKSVDSVCTDDAQTVVTITDVALAELVRQWLAENGYVDDGGYVLAAQEAQLLNEAFPELELPACTIQLILEADA